VGAAPYAGLVALRPPPDPTDVAADQRLLSGEFELRGRFQGRYPGTRAADGSDPVQGRLQTLFLEAVDRRRGIEGRIGRQSIESGAIAAAFDGVSADLSLPGALRLSAASGYPVAADRPGVIDTGRSFYALSAGLEHPHRSWSARVFALEYRSGPSAARTGVGGGVRYGNRRRWLLGWADYDTSRSRLAQGLLFARWAAIPRGAVSLLFDYRGPGAEVSVPRAPLRRRIRLLGAPTFDEGGDPVLDLDDDTGDSIRAVTVGLSRGIGAGLRLRGAFGLADRCTGAPYDAGASAPGREYRYSLGLTRSGARGAAAGVRLRMRLCGAYGAAAALHIGAHYPARDGLRLDPSLDLEVADATRPTPGRLWRLIPALGLIYRLSPARVLEARAGGEWSDAGAGTATGEGYYLHVAYRATF